jgi:uncharacterized protein (TIGR03067 family)
MVYMTSDVILGSWLPFRAELAGEHAPDMALAKMRLVIFGHAYAVYFGNEISDEGSYTLGAMEELKTITLFSVRGANAGRTIPSIYQLHGDRLRICFGLDGVAPTAFLSARGSEHYLVTYRRTVERAFEYKFEVTP